MISFDSGFDNARATNGNSFFQDIIEQINILKTDQSLEANPDQITSYTTTITNEAVKAHEENKELNIAEANIAYTEGADEFHRFGLVSADDVQQQLSRLQRNRPSAIAYRRRNCLW